MQPRTHHPALDHLAALVGEWETEATHQLLPGTVIHGRATFEWLEGGFFLIWRAHYDHPDIPDSIAIMGCDETGDLRNPGGGCSLHYFDPAWRYTSLSPQRGGWRVAVLAGFAGFLAALRGHSQPRRLDRRRRRGAL